MKVTQDKIAIWDLESNCFRKTFHKKDNNVQEYLVSPYSDDLVAVLRKRPNEFESFIHGGFDKKTEAETVPFIRSFPLIGSSFYGTQFQSEELQKAVQCSGGSFIS